MIDLTEEITEPLSIHITDEDQRRAGDIFLDYSVFTKPVYETPK